MFKTVQNDTFKAVQNYMPNKFTYLFYVYLLLSTLLVYFFYFTCFKMLIDNKLHHYRIGVGHQLHHYVNIFI